MKCEWYVSASELITLPGTTSKRIVFYFEYLMIFPMHCRVNRSQMRLRGLQAGSVRAKC